MENKIMNDELSENLPDYILNKLEDKNLIEKIENRLSSDPSFKTEFEEIRNTMSFLNSAEFTPPPDNYFSNLSVNINRRIEAKDKKFGFFSDPLFIFRKLIPVLGLIILAAYFIFSYVKNDTDKTETTVNEKINSDTFSKTQETIENKIKPSEEHSEIITPDKTSESKIKSPFISGKNKKINSSRSIIKSDFTIMNEETKSESETNYPSDTEITNKSALIADNQLFYDDFDSEEEAVEESEDTDMIYQTTDDNEDLEEELLQLSPEEKFELINNLKKSQL